MTETAPSNFDVVVIGGGPAGYGAALAASSAGKSVALIEAADLGGTCLHRGCIPAKHFLEAASVVRSIGDAARFGINVTNVSIAFETTQLAKCSLVDGIATGLAKLLRTRKVTIIEGHGRLLGPGFVEVTSTESTRQLSSASVILAPGSTPRSLAALPVDGVHIVNSDGFLNLKEIPARVAIVGGGAIGCEFASLLADLGATVTIFEGLPRLLAGCDVDVSRLITRSFTKRGITVRVDSMVAGYERGADGETILQLGDGSTAHVDLVVVSVGRAPLTNGLFGPSTELEMDDQGAIIVDDQQRTSLPGVYAIGDVVAGRPQLAHVGFAEALVAVGSLAGTPLPPVNYDAIPWAIYCHPEIAYLGLTEAQAHDRGISVTVKKDPIGGNSRAQIMGASEGFAKVICATNKDGRAGRVLGVHLVGPWATEQLSGPSLAVNLGLDVNDLDTFLAPHPALSETYGETLLALTGRGLHVH